MRDELPLGSRCFRGFRGFSLTRPCHMAKLYTLLLHLQPRGSSCIIVSGLVIGCALWLFRVTQRAFIED